MKTLKKYFMLLFDLIYPPDIEEDEFTKNFKL